MPTYVRVKDPDTGHEFDIPEDHPFVTDGVVKLVKSKEYPPSPIERPRKHHIELAGQSASRQPDTSPEGPDTATEKES